MAITINLKEIFTADSASDLSSKLNFNFNQLLALGVGQVGPTGPIGATGSAGPAGPIGPTGLAGPQIWSPTPSSTYDLSTNSPAGAVIGDYYIGSTAIYKKSTVNSSTVWDIVSDFNSIFNAIAISGTSTWQLGINPDANARIMVPIKNSKVNDRIIVPDTGSYTTNVPNWGDNTSTLQNSQGVLFNFDVETVKTLSDTGIAGLNNYTIAISGSRVGATPASINDVFPYTSLLSLYSFYQAAQSQTEADQYNSAIGYRHQLELGSVDDINEALHDTALTANYVISPTYQNLRVRKYRISAGSLPGKSVICADYNLHSTDAANKPAINSKHSWTINKKDSAAAGSNAVITMSLSNSIVEGTSAATTGITDIDGLHISIGGANPRKFAIGFDANDIKNILISSEPTSNMTTIKIKDLGLKLNSGLVDIVIDSTGISGNASFQIRARGNGSNMKIASELGDVEIFAEDPTQTVKIGSSTSNYAIGVQGDRLSTAVPMPTSTNILPAVSSSNPNTLDEYQEGEFTPTIHYGTINPVSSVLNLPTISNNVGVYTKIGKLFAFTIRFTISGFTLKIPSTTMPTPPYYYDPTIVDGAVTTGNIDQTQTDAMAMHAVGNERNAIQIRWDDFHWPDMDGVTSGFGTDLMKFPVSISATGSGGNLGNSFMLRSFPLHFSVGGASTPGTSSSTWPMEPASPGTVNAMFQTHQASVNDTSKPALGLFCNRRFFHNFPTFNSTTSARLGAVSTMQSRLTIWDFLNFEHPNTPAGNIINVVVNGSFLTGHKTAQEVWPNQTSNNIGVGTLNTGETIQ